MKKPKHFQVNILNDEYKVNVVISSSEFANKFISDKAGFKANFIEEPNRGKCISISGLHPIIWIEHTLDKHTMIGTVAHESVHAINSIMQYIAMNPVDQSGDEFLAHSVAAVVRKTAKELKW